MDKYTQEKLYRMGKEIPKHLTDKLIKSVPTEEYRMAQDILKDKRVPDHVKRIYQKSIENGTIKSHEQVVDKKVQKELDDFTTQRMKSEMDSGRIKPADKDDRFMREMQDRLKR